jgi:hypothetical protein
MKFMKTQDKNTQISIYCIQHYCKKTKVKHNTNYLNDEQHGLHKKKKREEEKTH